MAAVIVAIVNNFTDTHPTGNLHFLHLFMDQLFDLTWFPDIFQLKLGEAFVGGLHEYGSHAENTLPQAH